jgi:hypothetical protein
MAYVYKHIRLDNNEVFYIGIGSDSNYKRAFNKINRSQFWKTIVKKTEFKVELVADKISWDEACEIEKGLIKKYGRKNLANGTLVNLTDGGDGANGCKRTDKHKKILSNRMKGKKLSLGIKRTEENKRKIGDGVRNKYLEKMYDLDFAAANILF